MLKFISHNGIIVCHFTSTNKWKIMKSRWNCQQRLLNERDKPCHIFAFQFFEYIGWTMQHPLLSLGWARKFSFRRKAAIRIDDLFEPPSSEVENPQAEVDLQHTTSGLNEAKIKRFVVFQANEISKSSSRGLIIWFMDFCKHADFWSCRAL